VQVSKVKKYSRGSILPAVNINTFFRPYSYLLFAGVGHEVEEGHVLVAAGLGVGNPGEAVQLEAERVAALAPVHVIAEGEDDLQHLAEPLAPLHLLAALQYGLDLGPDLRQPDGELLLVVEGAEPLLVMRDPATGGLYQ
jgi:hypothetical protein